MTTPLAPLRTPHDASVAGVPSSTQKASKSSSKPTRDPVCGMSVDPNSTTHQHYLGGDTYYFCSASCRSKFAAEPQKYLRHAPGKDTDIPAHSHRAIYTCPMHPQIRQAGPGACPICGMALEPEIASAASGESAELTDMRRRFWISLALAVPVFALEMGGHITGAHTLLPQSWSNWVQLFLATPVVLW